MMNSTARGDTVRIPVSNCAAPAPAGTVEGLGTDVNRIHKFQKKMREIPRKLMGVDAVLDYDYAGPNPRHDPRKRGGNHP
ncbi:hypothetical protein FXO37_07574 [Capsicum annuum]|nr:hypothetical protein FXO37_07574 [Capsicum annuum]